MTGDAQLDDLEHRVGTILRGIASGLIPMAVFTPVYAVWAIVAWPIAGAAFFVAALAWSVYLATRAATLIRAGRPLPGEKNAYDTRVERGMAIVSSIQGGLILTSVIVLAIAGLQVWILPAVALVVALHFFPMPSIFGRTIDYYLGSAMLLVATVGIVLASNPDVSWQLTWGVTGAGSAMVTSAYGLYIAREGRRVMAALRSLQPA